MADRDDTLIVPVNVDALVVNQDVRERGGQGFRRWQPNFNLLRHNHTPEPDPFTNEEEWNDTKGTGSDETYKRHDGVYVRWELPDALRHGGTRAEGGSTRFPVVPNRWLVVRQVQGKPELTAGWVVESDFLDPDKGTSGFLHPVDSSKDPETTPYRATVIPTKIGRVPQSIGSDDTAWTEPAASDASRKEMFLTAVGPGVMTFHVYQPYHENVFSLHDKLTGVDASATLNYQVVGWYSDPANEELTLRLRKGTVESVLAGFGWSVADVPQGWTPDSTTYCGRALNVQWTSKGVPVSDLPDKTDVMDKVAVGSSADEAHAALVAGARAALPADSGNGIDHADPALLHVLGQGLLHALDEPDGDILTAQALHKGWFQQVPGGYVWRLADTADKGNTSGDPKSVTWSGVAPEHEAWLAKLNGYQSAYDEKARELAALQKRLYTLWWMHGLPLIPPQYSRERLRAEIDPANPDGLAAKVASELAELQKQQAALTDYVNGHALPDGYELRKETLPPFYQVTDPTVVLAGAKSHTAHQPLTKDGDLICRLPSQIVNDGRTNPFTSLRTAGLPSVVSALLIEFACVLDPKNAGKFTPDICPDPWRQPWKPLLFQWRVEHRQVPYGHLEDPNWAFDGSRYEWRKGDPVATPIEVTGRRFLVPLPQHTLSGGLERHAADHHDPAVAEALTAAAAEIKDLDLLSQRLDGLIDAFALRDPAPNLRPPGAIGDLVGDAFHHLPNAGKLPEPFKGWQPSGFTQIRAGQFAVARLSIVDEFGQTLDVLLPGDAEHFVPKVGDSLHTNGKFVEPTDEGRFVQLPPRLLQPARMRFDFVTEKDDEQLVDLTADTTPVGAWIVPNYVDRSLLCYAPTGEPLGELRLEPTADGSGGAPAYVIGWGPLPDSTVRTIDDLRDARPQLYALARELVAKGPDAFADLLATVDHALAGIDPGNVYGDEVLGALLGRPLALVRARLGFELDGPPVADAGWQYALDWKALTDWRTRAATRPAPPETAHLDYRWPVRLGNAGQKGDGLIGYFSEDAYGTFYAVAKPDTRTDYVAEISGANWPTLRADSTQRTHLTLLLDPMATVHATTDILPVTELRLPSRFTRTAMAAMQVALRLSPVLTTTRKVPVKGVGAGSAPAATFVNTLAMPHPTSPQGTWDWAELVVPDAPAGADPAPTWAHEPIVQIDRTARLDEDGPTVRTGFLRLSGGFGTK